MEIKQMLREARKKFWYVKFLVLVTVLAGGSIFGAKLYNDHHLDSLIQPVEAMEKKEVVEVREESMLEFIVRRFTEEGLSVDKAIQIISCESSFRPEIAIIEPNDTISFGLYQINSIHKNISHRDKLDYKKATEWTINKVKHDGNWSAWSCSRIRGITGK